MHASRLSVGLLSLVPAIGCMLEPGHGERVDDSTASLVFHGYLPTAGAAVQVRAASSPGGPFSPWTGSSTLASSTPAFDVPNESGGTQPLYPWSLSTAVPAGRWGTELGAQGCDVRATYVWAQTGPYNLWTFDAPSAGDPGGAACLVDEVLAGEGLLDALQGCASASSPVARLEAPLPNVHVGNVVITSQVQADSFACTTAIEGDLTISPASPTTIDLPHLGRVSGNVSLQLPVTASATGPYAEVRCGNASPSSVLSVITRVHVPVLAQIDGDLDIAAPSTGVPTTAGEPIELDLDALTDLGGSLSVEFGTPAVSPCGLSSLVATAGDVSLTFAHADVGGARLLPALTAVAGTVWVHGGYTLLAVLGNLQSAGALVLEDAVQPNPNNTLDALTVVDTTAHLRNLGGGAYLSGLSSAGHLILQDVGASTLATVGAASVTLQDLTLLSNPALSVLGSAASSNLNLTDGGALVIGQGADANPLLTAAEVCEFVGAQQSNNGWTPMGTGFSCAP